MNGLFGHSMTADEPQTYDGVVITPLRFEDEHAVNAAAWLLHHEWGEPQGDPLSETFEWLRSRHRNPRENTFCANLNGVVIGVASVTEYDDLPDFRHVAPWLSSVVVNWRVRRRGVGSALVEAACGWAAHQGNEEIYLWSRMPGFYRGRGFARVADIRRPEARYSVMRRAL